MHAGCWREDPGDASLAFELLVQRHEGKDFFIILAHRRPASEDAEDVCTELPESVTFI